MTEPQWLDVATPAVQLRALTWGPADAPIALCLHGFPDTAYGWRKVAPRLVDAGGVRSWYIIYFQLPWLPERSASSVVPRLWRDWSPGYRADEDLRHVDDAIGVPDRWRAALGYYRAMVRNSRPPAQYAELHQHWLSAPRLPTLICTAPMTVARQPNTRHGWNECCPTAASWRLSNGQVTSCSSISPMSSRVTSSTSSDRRPRVS